MFSTTFLGHQGWMFQSKRSCILVDPLLCEEFGHAHALDYRVHPPRVWTPAAFPAVDAVVLTHEHDDHFDIPSLAKLDRAIPIFLSSRSSSAARQILGEMGFQVHPLVPGRTSQLGDLELSPFPGDHVSVDCGDEWDTLPFIVVDTAGSGSFFSMVDITLTEQHIKWAHSRAPRPVLVGWTNNALDWSHMADFMTTRVDATQECFTKMGVGHKLIVVKWGTPAAMLMCAGGFAFHGDRSWLNQRVFCVDNEAVCQMLGKVYPAEQFHATRPGQTFVMEGQRLKDVRASAPFLTTAPSGSWPSRARSDAEAASPDYGPATGRRELDGREHEQLRRGLDELAGALVGGTIFRALHSLPEDTIEDRAPTFALVLRHGAGDERLVYAYVPSGCTFDPGVAGARDAYLAGMECWATDLLAVLRGEMSPIALTYGRARLWNALPERVHFDLFQELYRVSHPLRRPAEALAMYQRRWKESAGVAPTIRHRGAGA
jgi:Beta-lactamase superfamily domain